MFSFAGDTVLDPFGGTGSTAIAALLTGRNSVSNEIEEEYLVAAETRLNELSRKPRTAGAIRSAVCRIAS